MSQQTQTYVDEMTKFYLGILVKIINNLRLSELEKSFVTLYERTLKN